MFPYQSKNAKNEVKQYLYFFPRRSLVGGSSSRSDYYSQPGLSPPPFSHSLNGEWNDETPLASTSGSVDGGESSQVSTPTFESCNAAALKSTSDANGGPGGY